jgi:hypothetical protein
MFHSLVAPTCVCFLVAARTRMLRLVKSAPDRPAVALGHALVLGMSKRCFAASSYSLLWIAVNALSATVFAGHRSTSCGSILQVFCSCVERVEPSILLIEGSCVLLFLSCMGLFCNECFLFSLRSSVFSSRHVHDRDSCPRRGENRTRGCGR